MAINYKNVGIVGMPPLKVIKELTAHNITIHDLIRQ